jgi:hypothetical protein
MLIMLPLRSYDRRTGTQIVAEIYEELLSIVGSWRDTLDDHEVLSLLRDYNSGRPTLHRAQ